MNFSEDEPSSGLNGRLRPRKNTIPSPQTIKQIVRKLDGKPTQEKPKRSSTPSKASPSKPDHLTSTSDLLPTPQLLCPYCDKKFISKQTISKHVRRIHFSASKLDSSIICLFCNHAEPEPSDIVRHMVDSHPNQYFACLDCHTRFPSTKELAEHKLNVCEKQKIPYRSKLRQKPPKKSQRNLDCIDDDYENGKNFSGHGFNGIVISCELKPTHVHDEADIEDNITTNLILPPSKNLTNPHALDKNTVIVLDDIQWNRRIPSNFSFHNTDADQILSRLGVVHRSPKTGESSKKDWFRVIEDATQKFEKCFDTSFYSMVASNVQENMSRFLDGTFNFTPDPNSTIKPRKVKNSVVINTAEGFPILLACEQYSRNTYDGYMPRTIAPKHKWKWDSLENEKHWNPDQIKRDSHANNCIITLVSSLDIWTQLCMRRKFEDKFNITPVERHCEKQHTIGMELKEILESREIPRGNDQIIKYLEEPKQTTTQRDFPASLGLMPSTPKFNIKPAILSGEWVRPRCYVCCACGAQTLDPRALGVHVSTQHPNAQVQHYEIVGESLLKADILKHLYVPPGQSFNRTRPPRGFRDCTKCNKSVTIEDLHQHMLDCAGDTPTVRRKCRYRPFGVRRRRPRLPDNRIRKKMRNDIRTRQSRQKSRLRSRPKIRSEVGDAETIRKMLADLPAKRHRVVLNPLNSILRPRRKLNKQRAMLMMKRRSSEDPKSGKSRASHNSIAFDYSGNRDDDDKPLKPRLKRVTCKVTRQKESLSRKTMIEKPKRKIPTLQELKENKDNDTNVDTSTPGCNKVPTVELSADNNQQRINLNNNPQNARDHSAGGSGSDNGRRDNQPPGANEQNENLRNVCAPAQNVPLKHSIARLTANSETHDKSVQFHHLFLVQQECNNVNEHVPAGHRVLFENEAIVTKLDKPPLHFNPMESMQGHGLDSTQGYNNNNMETFQGHNLDSIQENTLESIQGNTLESVQGQSLDSLQKLKLNKPRKGLNDCIAMLKNKLVDTDTSVPKHVSVQCGTDDPIGPHPGLAPILTLKRQNNDVSIRPVQTYPETNQTPKKSSPKINVTEQLPRTSSSNRGQHFDQDLNRNVSVGKKATQWRPVNYDAIIPRYIDDSNKKEASRRRSMSQTENLLLAQQLLATSYHPDAFMKLSPQTYDNYSLPPQKISRSRQRNTKQAMQINEMVKRKPIDIQVHTATTPRRSFERNLNVHTERTRRSLDTCEKISRSRTDLTRKSIESYENSVPIRVDTIKPPNVSSEKHRKNALEFKAFRDFTAKNLEEGKKANVPQPIRKQRTSSLHADFNMMQVKQMEHNAKLNMNVPLTTRTEHNYNGSQGPIRSAAVNTNVEAVLSTPLDLSGKTTSTDFTYPSTHDSMTLTNYDGYQTLDLSNKNRITNETLVNEDLVVDLRIKHNEKYPSSLNSTRSSSELPNQDMNAVNALNLIQRNDCIPTDLSFKRKAETITLSHNVNMEEIEVQDLSKNKTNTFVSDDHLLLDIQPTDLSTKLEASMSSKRCELKENEVNEIHRNYDQVNTIDEPEDLSGTRNNVSVLLIEDQVRSEQVPAELPDTEINLSHIQDLTCNPTLRVPQYQMIPADSNLTSQVSRAAELQYTPVSNSVCTELRSQPQVTVNNTPTSCRSTNSTFTDSPVVVPMDSPNRKIYSDTNTASNVVVTTVAGSLPLYSLLNGGVPTQFTTFESTQPVYTVSTRSSRSDIDVTNPITLTRSLLSIPSTTITSTTPVYTLAGSTVVTPLNYATLPNTGHSIPYPPPCGTFLPEVDIQTTQYNSTGFSSNIDYEKTNNIEMELRSGMFNIDRDLEMNTGIALLPKEIVAMIRSMPSNHRCQLMGVLPQYLSKPIPILSTQTKQSVAPSMSMPIRFSSETPMPASAENPDVKPSYLTQPIKDESRLQYNVNLAGSYDSPSVSHTMNLGLHNSVIDLTDDEAVLKTDYDNVQDEEQSKTVPVQEASASVVPKSKSNNDKTASLRAVRIKAPSERQKSKVVINQVQCADILPIPGNDSNDTEMFKFMINDKFPDVQVSEISSSPLSNKNHVIDYPLPQSLVFSNISPHQSVLDDAVADKSTDQKQSQSCKQSTSAILLSDNSAICNETKDNMKEMDYMNSNKNNSICKGLNSNLNVISKNNSTISEEQKKLEINQVQDDDSEDDISLAIIVKQKQQRQFKMKSSWQIQNETSLCKTVGSHVDDIISIGTPLSNENKATIDVSDKKIFVSKTGTANRHINEHSLSSNKLEDESKNYIEGKNRRRKKGKKNHRNPLSIKEVEIQNKEDIHKNYQQVNNNEVKEIFESLASLQRHDNSTKLKTMDRGIVSESFSVLPGQKTKLHESKELSKNVLSNSNLKDVSNIQETPNFLDGNRANPVILNALCKEQDKRENIDETVQSLVVFNSEKKCSNEDTLVESEELSSQQNNYLERALPTCKVHESSTSNLVKNAVSVPSIYSDGVNIKNSNENYTESVPIKTSLPTFNEVDDVGLSLRRSRRGKSLFVEENEHVALVHSETSLEQKTPLTKKQLIFSKLLLDEENNIKNFISTDHKQLNQEAKISYSIIGNQTAKNIGNMELTSDEKNKSVKRKKSPPSKKKFKKNKILDNTRNIRNEAEELEPEQVITVEKSFTNSELERKSSVTNITIQEFDGRDVTREKELENCNISEPQNKLDTENINEQVGLGDRMTKECITVKRKIAPSMFNLDSNHSSKPKKSKLNDIKGPCNTLIQDAIVAIKDNHNIHNLPLAARRVRSKSVVVKSSGSMLYDPYDIDLEDMADNTEPFRNQRLSLIKTACSKNSKETENIMPSSSKVIATAVPEINSNSTFAVATNSKETICDSDESSKSDVPLQKYVEEKERKISQSLEASTSKGTRKVDCNETSSKKSKRKHKNVKQSPTLNNVVPVADSEKQSEEQIRSDQFMESFGFYSERKPRKSNLLATKKISETFHIIANESDDACFELKDRPSKKNARSDSRKSVEGENNSKVSKLSRSAKLTLSRLKIAYKRGPGSRYCHVCKKEFRRPDNLMRHQMTMLHISKLAEFEMNVKTTPVPDDPNYLVVFKQHVDKLRTLYIKHKMKKHSKKFVFPSKQQVLIDVHKTVKEQQLARRVLNRDEALFLDCCELLKESNKNPVGIRNISRTFFACCPSSYALACASAATYNSQSPPTTSVYTAPNRSNLPKKPIIHTSAHPLGMENFVPVTRKKPTNVDAQPTTSSSEIFIQRIKSNGPAQESSSARITEVQAKEKCDPKSEDDMKSTYTQSISNIEGVKKVENDAGLQEPICKLQPVSGDDKLNSKDVGDSIENNTANESSYNQEVKKSEVKKHKEPKERKNPDIFENVDIFEDKFDKIKRKCRSQAAAAKHVQAVVEPSISHKSRKKSEKKRAKKRSKKNYQNTVLTKGALKGYESVKVSIQTSEINMSGIAPPIVNASKKKKKRSSKKKKDRKNSVLPNKCDSNRVKDSSQRNVDVYEFMDNDSEILELRPSTIMERFRNINNKDLPSTSKVESPVPQEVESNGSVSDGDDFVYMSDAYVCDDESNEGKKSPSPLKRKEVTEKNAVMDKIFKNNAVRSEKKSCESGESPKSKVKPTADLDQLFDSLLENKPSTSTPVNDAESPKKPNTAQKRRTFSPIELSKYETKPNKNYDFSSKKIRSPSPALSSDSAISKRNSNFSSRDSSPTRLPQRKYDNGSPFDYGPSTSKTYEDSKKYDKYTKDYQHSHPNKYNSMLANKYDGSTHYNKLANDDLSLSPKSDEYDTYSKFKTIKDRSSTRQEEQVPSSYGGYDYYKADGSDPDVLSDDAGVARQRARRKCTVGKQNVLAETWSSESEPDGIPPRPNSAESVVSGATRKRKGRKKDGHSSGSRKSNKQPPAKKQEFESRTTVSGRNYGASTSGAGSSRAGGGGAGPSGVSYGHMLSLPGPSGVQPRVRPTTSFWADGDDEQEHVQQHGWIVGDSHKKLVTMLAHAKGRKRNNDDKRHMLE